MDIDDANDAISSFEVAADNLLSEIKHKMPERLAQERKFRAEFEARLYERWKEALDLFEAVMLLSLQAGIQFNQKHSQRAAEEKDIVFDVQSRLHARACHTASEVRALLVSGHATAALARWRTLHEVAVVSLLMRDHGRSLAERYLHHDVIEAVKASEEYQRHCVRLGYEPLAPEELTQGETTRNALIQRYGPSFSKSYGWAAQALGKKDPNFSDLELAVQLDHLRPYYRMASHGVHSNPKGIIFALEHIGQKEEMIAGASNFGLADPGHAALISLLQCTSNFLLSKQDEESNSVVRVLERLVEEAGQAFLKTHQQLVSEEQAKNETNERI